MQHKIRNFCTLKSSKKYFNSLHFLYFDLQNPNPMPIINNSFRKRKWSIIQKKNKISGLSGVSKNFQIIGGSTSGRLYFDVIVSVPIG